ncbi:RidA family protein [Micromonospora cathayae]|uniref:Rid family hydrolase n=1 Tax=Micromonospora cathayae TaxID=3028804 RepID=A0ABY7ZP59_9ACTN|nr:Rid family hydrolase [Micromonospora sp. HUAS 3]WDZ84815.1 Rid family hydrolase [Micromonospora sp. HUAS 3]
MAQRTVVPGLFPPPDYAHLAVVEAGTRLVFAAGAVPLDADGNLVGPDDPVVQAGQVIANLAEALAAAGCGLSDVIASTVYVVASDPEPLGQVWQVVRESELAAGPHTSTLLGVSCLGYPGQLVEITATAAAS